MDESAILRGQLATERIHAAQVVNACLIVFGSAREPLPDSGAFREASVSYLAWVLSRFEQRDQLLGELIAASRTAGPGVPEGSVPAELADLAAREGTSRQALTRLERALSAASPELARAAWQAFGQFFNTLWCERREAIEGQLARLPRIVTWRAVSAIDADSILEERARYAQVAECLPTGVALLGATGQ